MNEKLEELAAYIRQTLPQSKTMTHLEIDPKAGFVSFVWHGRKFIVKPNYEVLELKGDTLFLTAASRLMHAAFTTRDRNSKVLSAVEETCGQVQDFLSHHRPEKALELLTMAKKTLARLAGVNVNVRGAGMAGSRGDLRQSLPIAA
jgi:hypothetical protein